ncbi:DUF4174 domain-containing protein [Verrucomicrobiaceae bacterium R5-34]|nr:DUF4174 domain-containing protein [Verrucomicrobiaceae bacterium R5-34]
MRTTLCTAGLLIAGVLISCAKEKPVTLEKYQWKKRLILSYPIDAQAWAEQLKSVRAHYAKMEERDLVMLRLDAEMQSFSAAERKALIVKYQLSPGSHVLIGKDGGEKARQQGALDLKPWIQLIDTMPMRRNEMKKD